MELLFIIIVTVFAIQVILALYAGVSRREIKHKFITPIGQQVRLSELIERYWNEFKVPLTIRATDEISLPAFYFDKTLLISRKHLLFSDLFTLYYFIFQTEIGRRDFKAYVRLPQILNALFFGSVLFLVLGLLSSGDIRIMFFILALGFQIISLVTSLIYIQLIKKLLFEASVIATYVLVLDDVEQARLIALTENMKMYHMEYPFETLFRIMGFFRI